VSATATAGRWVPLKEAAPTLRLSIDALRRRIRTKQVRARRTLTADGPRWLVLVTESPGVAPTMAEVAPGVAEEAAEQVDGGEDAVADEPREPWPTTVGDGTTIQAAQRAREMADYSERLLAPWRARVEELGRECGRLGAEADHLRERLAEERAERERWEAVLAEAEAAVEVPAPSRRWWQFWRWAASVTEAPAGAATERS
jgi:hypothetical protein